ncbi:MAG: hypothetical protein IPK97_19715 [Ahniella sp.]|nr:hypothetical protein [Ahniella sp.]
MFLVEAPVKGDAWRSNWVGDQNLPEAHAFLHSSLIDGRPLSEASGEALGELQRIGLLVPAGAVSKRVDYDLTAATHCNSGTCVVSEVDAREVVGAPVRSNGFRIPDEWRSPGLALAFHRQGGIFGPVLAAEAESSGRSLAAQFDPPEVVTEFSRTGFVCLDQLLPHSHVLELGRYFQSLADEGYLERHDDRGTHRHIAHNHPVANFWHDQINARVSHLAGRPTKPSYSFASLYEAGGDLDWHTDRPPCEYTITLLLDYAPTKDDGHSPWPLRIRGRDQREHSIQQRIGDALIFRGRELEHSRPQLPAGHRSSSLLFHFVDFDYAGVMS